jgi:hypothetical protein
MADLEQKLRNFQGYFNQHRVHSGMEGRLQGSDANKVTLNFES